MLNVILTKSGIVETEGTPSVFLEDDDFSELCQNQELADKLFEFFGKNTCIGRLGTKEDTTGVYAEKNISIPEVESEKGNYCYYERVRL